MRALLPLFLVLFCVAPPAVAQASAEKPLALDGSIAPTGRAVELRWTDARPPRVGSVIVNRRRLGETGAASWQALGPALGPVLSTTDETVEPGVAYEYQVMRVGRDIVDVGYWVTGVDLPAVAARGTVHVVVDETLTADLAAHLERFARDLVGDGWRVQALGAPRDDPRDALANLQAAASIREALRARYLQDPAGLHAVVLVGRVPIPMSGMAAPDGHKAEPHPTDLLYADMDGRWRASPEGALLENSLPGDDIDMQVGRIDFAGQAAGDHDREIALLRAYFDKTHHWRQGLLAVPRAAYGQNNNLVVEQHGLRNIVGPGAVEAGGHHDAGVRQPWLFGVDFGDHDGRRYATEHDIRAVFAINFGSGKQKIHKPANAMRALLAQPWYPLAVGWGGRPAWRLHLMALGGTVGEMHRRTVNNGESARPYRETMDYYPTGNYLWRNPVWVNLLGDPTLHAFPLAPPGPVTAEETPEGVRVAWAASPDPAATGYRVFRAAPGSAEFLPLTEAPQEALSLLDPDPVPGARYMVRAHGLRDVYAGSFFVYSQGVFDGQAEDMARDIALTTRAGQPVALPEVFAAPQGSRIHALIEGPARGTLERSETGWLYTPPAGFTGEVPLRFSVSDAWHTDTADLTITVAR